MMPVTRSITYPTGTNLDLESHDLARSAAIFRAAKSRWSYQIARFSSLTCNYLWCDQGSTMQWHTPQPVSDAMSWPRYRIRIIEASVHQSWNWRRGHVFALIEFYLPHLNAWLWPREVPLITIWSSCRCFKQHQDSYGYNMHDTQRIPVNLNLLPRAIMQM